MTDEYLPIELRHLTTDGVTPLGRLHELTPAQQRAAVPVRVRGGSSALGQWVGTYSKTDARLVADRIAAAIPGARVGVNRAGDLVVSLAQPPAMSAAEFLSILEATGHAAEEDAARALGKSRSMIVKLKAGTAPVSGAVAEQVRALQDEYADARDAALNAAPAELAVWRDNAVSWEESRRPARWHRMIAAECAQEHGTRIDYLP